MYLNKSELLSIKESCAEEKEALISERESLNRTLQSLYHQNYKGVSDDIASTNAAIAAINAQIESINTVMTSIDNMISSCDYSDKACQQLMADLLTLTTLDDYTDIYMALNEGQDFSRGDDIRNVGLDLTDKFGQYISRLEDTSFDTVSLIMEEVRNNVLGFVGEHAPTWASTGFTKALSALGKHSTQSLISVTMFGREGAEQAIEKLTQCVSGEISQEALEQFCRETCPEFLEDILALKAKLVADEAAGDAFKTFVKGVTDSKVAFPFGVGLLIDTVFNVAGCNATREELEATGLDPELIDAHVWGQGLGTASVDVMSGLLSTLVGVGVEAAGASAGVGLAAGFGTGLLVVGEIELITMICANNLAPELGVENFSDLCGMVGEAAAVNEQIRLENQERIARGEDPIPIKSFRDCLFETLGLELVGDALNDWDALCTDFGEAWDVNQQIAKDNEARVARGEEPIPTVSFGDCLKDTFTMYGDMLSDGSWWDALYNWGASLAK